VKGEKRPRPLRGPGHHVKIPKDPGLTCC
jgi:hypothetical protein